MQALNSAQRAHLKKRAHDLSPVVHIGKSGLSQQVVDSTAEALAVHELIKVKFGDYRDQKQALSEELAQRTNSALVSIIGNIAIFYRPAADPDKRRITLPVARTSRPS